jgi:hypothetical protein
MANIEVHPYQGSDRYCERCQLPAPNQVHYTTDFPHPADVYMAHRDIHHQMHACPEDNWVACLVNAWYLSVSADTVQPTDLNGGPDESAGQSS